jgi:ferredoxin-NADP reductase/anaerobic selenocysteine-containing dehydrogenase
LGNTEELPIIAHAGVLEDLAETPGFLLTEHAEAQPQGGRYSCSFCGVGDSGILTPRTTEQSLGEHTPGKLAPGRGLLRIELQGKTIELQSILHEDGRIEVATSAALTPQGGALAGELQIGSQSAPVTAREVGRELAADGSLVSQTFAPYRRAASVSESIIRGTVPTSGCVKLRISMMRQRPAFPIHVAPSLLEGETGARRSIAYQEAISRFADLLLEHCSPQGKILIYACGQIDYFTIFAMQEVFRLLGVRNLTGNAEHCLNSGAVHNEILTGQEGPFLTVEQGLQGPDRFYLLNGWNGFITHPPAFNAILKRGDLDAYLIEVMVTESARALAKKLGPERVLLIRPGSDPHLALSVAHEILENYPEAVARAFIERFSDPATFEQYIGLARSERFAPVRVAERIAAEPGEAERIFKGIRMIAYKMTRPSSIPINIPSVGLSQTSGAVAHCLWGSVLGMLGKYGLTPDGTPAGGTLRLPGQINAESEVQGLSRKYFMGRIPMELAADAAIRMGLPEDAYAPVLKDTPRAALDYSDPNPDQRELFICLGTQFESNMMGRSRWIAKLRDPGTHLVVIDPIPDPFTLEHADLIIPSPPHPATTKLYQNGEWKLSLSTPQKRAPRETRSDATILYDVMAEIARRLETDPAVAEAHPDLARHAQSGYLRARFMHPGLTRIEDEVSRPQLWDRILDYMSGGSGPLYCRPEHTDGRLIRWDELLEKGSVTYGGVGVNRYVLDYDKAGHQPFGDVFRRPRKFKFFTPTEEDLAIPEGVILNSGRSCLSDDPARIRFATSTFNSGKATPIVDMPDENPVYVSPTLAERLKLQNGSKVRLIGRQTGESITLPAVVTDRVKGDVVYVSFHKNKAEIEEGRYLNTITSHRERCPYTAQTRVKATAVALERVEAVTAVSEIVTAPAAVHIDTTLIDPKLDLPIWQGQTMPLYVTEIIQETHDVFTFRFQGDPLCRFTYWPGQFCSLVLNIEGRKVVRSYSISSTPTRPFVLEITIKRVPGGLVSNWMPDHLKPGDRIEIAGPKGKFCLVPGKIPPKLLFLAAGSGVTPLMSMARWLCDLSANVDIKFFNSVRSPQDIIFGREIEMLTARYKMFAPVVVTTTRMAGSNWTGLSGRISRNMLEMIAPDLHERHIYMCGPDGFMETVKGILAEVGYDIAKLHLESFGGLRTSVSNKSAPLMPGSDAIPAETEQAPASALTIEFARSGRVSPVDGALTLLDLIEAQDIDIGYGCRAGSCGDCKARLLEGEVEMACEDGLEPEERDRGYILTCVARPKTNCTLDL